MELIKTAMKVYIITNDVELARKQMHEEICREWQETAPSAVMSGIAPCRVLTSIAQRHGMSMQNVDKILRKAGVYQGAKHFRKTVIENAVEEQRKEQQRQQQQQQ
jgi:hypothetical protein